MRSRPPLTLAFTLIELSITLVIIGLIVGGVLVGRDLIRAAEIQNLRSDTAEMFTAVRTFQTKYERVPGELTTYANFFPQLSGYCPSETFRPGTINGLIDNTYEFEAAFAQLHAAGLITIGHTQILSNGTELDIYNCFQNGMQQLAGMDSGMNNLYGRLRANSNRNGVQFGANNTPALTIQEAYAFDQKYDDGISTTGRFTAVRANVSGLQNCTNSSASGYTISNTSGLDDLNCYVILYEGL